MPPRVTERPLVRDGKHHISRRVATDAVGQRTLPINAVTSMSSDNVGLVFDAAITTQVVDVRKAVTQLGGDGFGDGSSTSAEFSMKAIDNALVEKARATVHSRATACVTAWGGRGSGGGALRARVPTHSWE